MDQAHVVIQTLWRSRGTYFWSKLRNDIRNRAYYEPLHEELVSRPPEVWRRNFSSGVTRILRHPQLDRHYAAEYPLLKDGGLSHFEPRFPFGNFVLSAQDRDDALESYLKGLVAYAGAFGQRACFKFTRGGLRAGFLRRVLGGRHLYVNRPPAEIVASCQSFGAANYFLGAMLQILQHNADDEFCAAVADALTASPSGVLNARQVNLLIAAFWWAYLVEGLASADTVIDTERLGTDAAYRREMSERTQDIFGPGALDDFRATPAPHLADETIAALQALARRCDRLARQAASIPPGAFSALGEASRRVVESLA